MACHCKRVGCSLQLSLGPVHDLHGNRNCAKPTMCTTHGDFRNRKELCGDQFAEPAKVFTVFREPVSRVFSLYNYEKAQQTDLPSIADIYNTCDTKVIDDEFLSSRIGWFCRAMINKMTLGTFSENKTVYTAREPALLEHAKTQVSKLDAVFFMEDFDSFAEAFEESSLVSNMYLNPHAKRCELGHSNPTVCATCSHEPTPEERRLIEEHNQMDVELYNYATGLQNRYKGKSMSEPPEDRI